MGQVGPIPISRAAAPNPQLPASQGYIGTGGPEFTTSHVPFVVPAPPIGIESPAPGIGFQWAPGQGGDTPGGGGAATWGQTQPVETVWYNEGTVVPGAIQHIPGTVGARGYRRSRA